MVNDRLHYSKRSFSYQVLFYIKLDFNIIDHQLGLTCRAGRFDVCAAAATLEGDDMRPDDIKLIGAA